MVDENALLLGGLSGSLLVATLTTFLLIVLLLVGIATSSGLLLEGQRDL